MEVEEHKGDVVIRWAVPRFTLAELFRGKSAAEWRAAHMCTFDWGPDVGREGV